MKKTAFTLLPLRLRTRHFFCLVSRRRGLGFTLIELLVVIVIIGILATISVASFNDYKMKANNTKIIMQAAQYQKVLSLYYTENEHYPMTDVNVSKCLGNYGATETCLASLITAQILYGDDSLKQVLSDTAAYLPSYPKTLTGANGAQVNSYLYNCRNAGCTKYALIFMVEGKNKNCGGLKGLMETDPSEPDYWQPEMSDTNSTANIQGHTYCVYLEDRGRLGSWGSS